MAEQAVVTKPAFESEQVQAALKTRKQRKVTMRPITDLVEEIKQQNSRIDDRLVPFSKLRAAVVVTKTEDTIGEDGVQVDPTNYGIRFKIDTEEMPFYEGVIQQACNLTNIGDRTGVPSAYIKRLLVDDRDQQLVNLAAVNLNEFYTRRSGEIHARGKKVAKAVFVRALKNEEGVPVIRALLSDRYFILNNLDILMTALAIVTKTNDGGTAAKDARAFDWHLDPFRFELGFVNPGYAFDLRNPDKGVFQCEAKQDDHGWVYPGGGTFDMQKGWTGRLGEGDKTQHLVFPACFISNSETGGGSANVEMAFMEAACINTARLGQTATKRHLGGLMETADDYTSDETKKKVREAWLAMMADSLKQVFDMKKFEENCKAFLGLASIEIKDVKKVTEHLISAVPGADALLDEVLKAYSQFNSGRNTVLDVQRALTTVAQDQPHEKAVKLETIAGNLITGEAKVPKEMLLVAGNR